MIDGEPIAPGTDDRVRASSGLAPGRSPFTDPVDVAAGPVSVIDGLDRHLGGRAHRADATLRGFEGDDFAAAFRGLGRRSAVRCYERS